MTLQKQLACARRELALRKVNYPRWVAKGSLDAEQAAHEIEAMGAICETLEKMKMLEEVSIEVRGLDLPFVNRQADIEAHAVTDMKPVFVTEKNERLARQEALL